MRFGFGVCEIVLCDMRRRENRVVAEFAQEAVHRALGEGAGQGMRPNAQYVPAEFFQAAADFAVVFHILRNLHVPELLACRGQAAVFGTTVPETAVDKHREPRACEHEVGMPRDFATPPPTAYSAFTHQFHQAQFRLFVPLAANLRHHVGTFFFRENVHVNGFQLN